MATTAALIEPQSYCLLPVSPEEFEYPLGNVVVAQIVRVGGQVHLFEVFVMLLEFIHHLKARSRVDVVVDLTVDYEEFPLQPPCVVHVGIL